MKRIIVGATALALAVAVAPSAAAQDPEYGVTTTTIAAGEDCGTATVTWTNPTDWTFWGDYRVGDETGVASDDVAPDQEIAEGPLAGETFGHEYHRTEITPGGEASETITLPEDATGTVDVSAWVKRGPEQRSFSAAGPVAVTACDPVDPSEPPVDPSEPPVDPSEPPTDPSTDPSVDPSVDPSKTNAPTPDQDGDEAEDDGSAPTPTPQKAHLAVTG